jgi:hypothetical protein
VKGLFEGIRLYGFCGTPAVETTEAATRMKKAPVIIRLDIITAISFLLNIIVPPNVIIMIFD